MHAEIIQDWIEYLEMLSIIDDEAPQDSGTITQAIHDEIEQEINACEEWHDINGTLFSTIIN